MYIHYRVRFSGFNHFLTKNRNIVYLHHMIPKNRLPPYDSYLGWKIEQTPKMDQSPQQHIGRLRKGVLGRMAKLLLAMGVGYAIGHYKAQQQEKEYNKSRAETTQLQRIIQDLQEAQARRFDTNQDVRHINIGPAWNKNPSPGDKIPSPTSTRRMTVHEAMRQLNDTRWPDNNELNALQGQTERIRILP